MTDGETGRRALILATILSIGYLNGAALWYSAANAGYY